MFSLKGHGGRAPQAASWNTRYAGAPALSSVNGIGYRAGALLGTCQLAHRVAWAIHHGEWPKNVDHINGKRTDNRIVNLRSVSRSQNQRNMKRNSNNTSGVTGVYSGYSPNTWRAAIKVRGRTIALGTYERKQDAMAARKAAERKYGFHPNHGRPK